VIVGNVALDSGSLCLFAERGIPVTMLSREGSPLAILWGLAGRDRQRRSRQRAFSHDPCGQEKIGSWLNAWKRGRQLALAAAVDPNQGAEWRRKGYRQSDYERWLAERASAVRAPHDRRAFFQGALSEVIAAEVAARGWDPHFGVRFKDEPLGFVKDLTAALEPEAHRLWLQTDGAGGRSLGWSGLSAAFETACPRIMVLVRRMLEQYAELLWDE
jgi:hypothetical protein